MGGLGSGKTRTGAEAFVDAVLENPRCETMFVAPTWPMMTRLTLPAFQRAMPREYILEHRIKDRCFVLRGGRVVWYGTAQVPGSLEGSNLAGVWGDEVRYWPHASYQNLIARLRAKAARIVQGIFTSTPAMGWMEEEFARGLEERRLFRIATTENAINLAPGYIENLRRSLSPRLAKSLIDGEFSVVEGQVYECFDDARHLVEWRYDPSYRTYLFWDFAVRKSAILLAQETGPFWMQTPDGRQLPPHSVVVFDELMPEEMPTTRQLPMAQAMMRRHGIARADAVFCDPAGNARSQDAGMTSVHLIRQSGIAGDVRWVTSAEDTWIPNGIALVEGRLNPLEGEPTLYLSRELSKRRNREAHNDFRRGVYGALRGLQYPEKRTAGAPDHPVKDGHYEHAADALRYGVINIHAWRRAEQVSRERLGAVYR